MLLLNENPWMGLASYDVADSHLFFGRETEILNLEIAIKKNLSTVIYGESGAGKTSLIRAGLFPNLTEKNYLPVWIRLEHNSTEDYFDQIERRINEEVTRYGYDIEYSHNLYIRDLSAPNRLWMFLYSSVIWNQSNDKVHPIIFFDQFEELFTQNSSRESVEYFFESIADISQQIPNSTLMDFLEDTGCKFFPEEVPQVHFVYSMREDFLGALENATSNCSFLFNKRVCVKKLNGNQALDVILKPRSEIIDITVAKLILKKLSGENSLPSDLTDIVIEPTLLSLFCSELYRKVSEKKLSYIPYDIVDSSGGDIIYKYYTKAVDKLGTVAVKYIETELVSKNGFRKQLFRSDIDEHSLNKNSIDHLLYKRIIRRDLRRGEEYFEFTHDVLCQQAKRHRDENKNYEKYYDFPILLFYCCELFPAMFILDSVLRTCIIFSEEIFNKSIILLAFSMFGTLLMRSYIYLSHFGRIYSLGIANIILSLIQIVLLNEIQYSTSCFTPFYFDIYRWFFIISAFLILGRMFLYPDLSKNKLLHSLKRIRKPILILPMKLCCIWIISKICLYSGTFLNLTYSKIISIIGLFVISNIMLSLVLIKKDKLKAPVYIKVIYYFVIGLICPILHAYSNGIFSSERSVFSLFVLLITFFIIFLLILPLLKYYSFPFTKYVYHIRSEWRLGIIFILMSLLFRISHSLSWANCYFQSSSCHLASYIVPEINASYGKFYYNTIKSIDKRLRSRLIPYKDKSGKIGLCIPNYLLKERIMFPTDAVLPADFAEINQVVKYKPLKINDDGTVVLSEYIFTVKKEKTDTLSTVYLSDYLCYYNNLSASLCEEMSSFYHSSASARRMLDYYYQLTKINNKLTQKAIEERHMIFKGNVNEINPFSLKWMVLANRMKEILAYKEKGVSKLDNLDVNFVGELFRKGIGINELPFSSNFISSMSFLTSLSEKPSAFSCDEIMSKCTDLDLDLERAVRENLDILENDPAFKQYIDKFINFID